MDNFTMKNEVTINHQKMPAGNNKAKPAKP